MLKIKSLFRVNGLFLILFGLFLFFKPELALNIVIIIFGIEVLLSGIIGIIFAWGQKEYAYRGLLFFGSLIQIIFGVLLLFFPEIGHFLVSLLIVILGIAIIIKGILTFFDGFKAKEAGISTRWLQFLMGGLAILFGIFLVTNAFLSFLLLNILLGITLIISGITILVFGFQVQTIKTESLEYDDE